MLCCRKRTCSTARHLAHSAALHFATAPLPCQAGGGSSSGGPGGERSHVVKFYRNNVFTVDGGPARHMDDPANLAFIGAVSKGECPAELDPGDADAPVTVNLLRVEEDYEAPK